MNKKRLFRSEFYLEETSTTVIAKLAHDEKIVLDFKNDKAPSVRVRTGAIDQQRLLDAASYWATRDWNHPTPASWLDFYAACRHKDVCKEILEIRKSIKRIAASMDEVAIAMQLKSDIFPDAHRPGS